jgi:iron complex transport system substrate-binding protein
MRGLGRARAGLRPGRVTAAPTRTPTNLRKSAPFNHCGIYPSLSMRICSLLPSATEILYALDLGPSVVGVSHDCDYPADVRNKPMVIDTCMASGLTANEIDRVVATSLAAGESLYTIDIDLLARLAPDLILTQALCDVCTIDEAQLARAIYNLKPQPDVLTLAPLTLGDAFDDIERVGRATGTARRAAALMRSYRKRIARVRGRTGSSRPSVVCLEWLSPPYVAGHWIPDMVEIAGGAERLARRGAKSVRTEWDAILAVDPDVLIVMPCGFDTAGAVAEYRTAPLPAGWDALRAVRTGRVYAVDASAYFSRSGPRLLDGIELLSTLLHDDPPHAPVDRWAQLDVGAVAQG